MSGRHPIDVKIGSRIQLRRRMLGTSIHQLGGAIGVGVDQMRRYERGITPIAASSLHELSRLLDVPIAFFFDDTDPVRAPGSDGDDALVEAKKADPLHQPESVELVTTYFAIERAAVRQALSELIQALALWVSRCRACNP